VAEKEREKEREREREKERERHLAILPGPAASKIDSEMERWILESETLSWLRNQYFAIEKREKEERRDKHSQRERERER
jgi:hypothetical protein